MAITKIMNIGAGKQGNIAIHLHNALDYIANAEKTENGVLVGYINCMEGMVFEQMCQTKRLYGKVGGRQGYHFVLSLAPGEGSVEQMFEVVREFAEEFLRGEYEAMYSVHTDKNHIHAHLIFNSVNLVTGRKFEYKKGDWKYKIQPITNRLCEKHGLSIVPAEYSKDPVNMNRRQWEKEQSWTKIVEEDVRYLLGKANDFEHFLFLMEQLGYEVKRGKHLAVKSKEMKRFRRLDTINEEYTEENIKKGFEHYRWSYESPSVQAPNTAYMRKPGNEYQEKYYLQIVHFAYMEKYRFDYQNRHQSEVKKMQETHERYLYLVKHGINGVEGILKESEDIDRKLSDLSNRQKKLYKERAERNRKCKTEDDICEFVLWEENYHKELEKIKNQKKELLHQKKLGKQCIVESIVQSNYFRQQVLEEEKKIGNRYDVPVPKPSQERYEDEWESENCIDEEENKVEEMEEVVVVAKSAIPTETEKDKEIVPLVLLEEKSNVEMLEIPKVYQETAQPDVEKNETEDTTVMTKQKYEALSDEEKMKWTEIDLEDVYGSMKKFRMRMEELGIRFDTIGEYTDEYMRLCDVAKKQSGYQREYCHERDERRR